MLLRSNVFESESRGANFEYFTLVCVQLGAFRGNHQLRREQKKLFWMKLNLLEKSFQPKPFATRPGFVDRRWRRETPLELEVGGVQLQEQQQLLERTLVK